VEPLLVDRAGQERFDVARRRVEAACHTDYMFPAMHALMSGHGRAADLTVREIFMAESVRRLLDRDPDARVVLIAHNNHIQKTPAAFDGTVVGLPMGLPMGLHLHRALGDDYRAVALTHTAGSVPEMYPDADAAVGFTVAEAPLPAPEPGSVEAGLADAGLGDQVTLTSLRAPGAPPLDAIRTQSALMRTPLAEAFDAVLSVPSATRDPDVRF
jgi:erythromycin esterase